MPVKIQIIEKKVYEVELTDEEWANNDLDAISNRFHALPQEEKDKSYKPGRGQFSSRILDWSHAK